MFPVPLQEVSHPLCAHNAHRKFHYRTLTRSLNLFRASLVCGALVVATTQPGMCSGTTWHSHHLASCFTSRIRGVCCGTTTDCTGQSPHDPTHAHCCRTVFLLTLLAWSRVVVLLLHVQAGGWWSYARRPQHTSTDAT